MSAEEINRDMERAQEYEVTTSRVSPLGENRFELSTGIIIAARFADKLRRVALVSLSRIVDREIIIRDISELNKELFNKLTEMKIGKLDLVKIVVEARYNREEKKLHFENVKITRYYTEEQCRAMNSTLSEENEKLRKELEKIKATLEQLTKSI
ncbi:MULTISPECIES: DUF2258 domain-containing protein [Metallosphaera]|uniref:DUF2258 domain-containing protein n=3 Tax=Metallosphaera TaxID=41980 RepID=A4YFK6_METS5|nr:MULTISPECIES: single- stranded DNA-binding family protein [Metallosphaera]ABP95208.1 conserved hypothetical protein [Metallosphaera sedula DSM 5348]AIM27194.1 hypothetical protein HA72_1043 [Metallosphaera sedula]AKV74090.1 hypothetical protein MsedA_1056 [Metallosphaera sedula]AKV76330.1 hypothetical protein MsedB_1058 [Metallosphaera sedula]AKV78581.1 hypothetical protein MsedC_1056 [Metallosphaera sedula]